MISRNTLFTLGVGIVTLHFSAFAATVNVEIQKGKFVPAVATAQAGDTIVFTNATAGKHTATADPAAVANPENVQLPEGADTFDSGIILPGNSFSLVLSVAGTYRYVCIQHEAFGMAGSIEVLPATELE